MIDRHRPPPVDVPRQPAVRRHRQRIGFDVGPVGSPHTRGVGPHGPMQTRRLPKEVILDELGQVHVAQGPGQVELPNQFVSHGRRWTSNVCATVPINPWRSKISAVVTPMPSGPMEPRPRTAKSLPRGSRCRCTAVSVFMNTNFSGSSAAPAPLAQSTTIASRWSSVVGSESTRDTRGLSQTTFDWSSAVRCVRQLTVCRYPLVFQLRGIGTDSPSTSGG